MSDLEVTAVIDSRISVNVEATVNADPALMSAGSYGGTPIRVQWVRVTFDWTDDGWQARNGITAHGARVRKNGELYDESLARTLNRHPTGGWAEDWAEQVIRELAPQWAPMGSVTT